MGYRALFQGRSSGNVGILSGDNVVLYTLLLLHCTQNVDLIQFLRSCPRNGTAVLKELNSKGLPGMSVQSNIYMECFFRTSCLNLFSQPLLVFRPVFLSRRPCRCGSSSVCSKPTAFERFYGSKPHAYTRGGSLAGPSAPSLAFADSGVS